MLLLDDKSVEKCGEFMGVDMLLLDDKAEKHMKSIPNSLYYMSRVPWYLNSEKSCLKHQRKWKSVPNYTKSWYDRGPEIYKAEKYMKGARKTGSVSASGMLYIGVKKLETVMVDAVCFSTFTSLLIVQS
ncbi:hypothetical protein F2Q68_00026524 [Brassica cretica]|uniref:Pre-mRNA-splicing factor SLU7 n=1 Tax=Brassica cretica TaxID=69181 RepID=A0A8S9IGH9_BRACR|nr:hypothetical protein F2Q68_00026524 [Brassica cretica]